ncbi:uncharacterized protein N7529_006159 [Penicillium soppii]|uniref:uncharacterized protein n=1 Tax=Penicillium soppii TaxID=69789 RepID=UPI0025492582|nr:uncharacterized protein N7529_006159 [Penicillium soppii]KAJ5864243.1 hypothetical protein N7529_006159 [Penicillium soppii]
MVTPAESPESLNPQAQKKKRSRRAQKGNTLNIVGVNPKKTLFVDEIGDILIDQLCATTLHSGQLEDSQNGSCVSVMDHLRGFKAAPTISSCASSSNYSTRTRVGSVSTPTTSLDSHEPLQYASSQAPTEVDLPCPTSNPKEIPSSTKDTGDQAEVFGLDDFTTMTAIERLAANYGRVAHMGILDRSYRFFVNKSRTAALSFKIQNGIAIIGGDPLAPEALIPSLLSEFTAYRKRYHWGIAFMGASESFLKSQAHPNNWTTIRFGTERVLNPQTNEVLLETSGKRITTQNRQLLNKAKAAITLHVYVPAVHGTDVSLESDLISIYDSWRAQRNDSASPQAFITVYDPFALPSLMTFIYTRSAEGVVNGFAALRRLGSGGYHVDPCIAAPGSSKGISDLLLVAAMALLNRAGVSYLGFGFEPLHSLSRGDVVGMPRPLRAFTRDLYCRAFSRLPIGGKKAYHDKFRPDPMLDRGLYLVFPSIPGPRLLLAMTHMANISLRKIVWADVRGWVERGRGRRAVERRLRRRKLSGVKGIQLWFLRIGHKLTEWHFLLGISCLVVLVL